MAKRKTRTAEQAARKPSPPEPKLTRIGYQLAMAVILLALIAQLVMAVIVYPQLPPEIPASWAGQLTKGETVPSTLVFVLFPLAQLIMLVVGRFSPADKNGKLVMETGKAATLIVLSGLFTALQASAFRLPQA